MAVFNHIGHVVSDPERSMRFYQEVLGFSYWYKFAPDDESVAKLCALPIPSTTTAYYLRLDGFVLELMHYATPSVIAPYRERNMSEPGLTHLSVSVDDIRASANKAVEYGGVIVEESDLGFALMIRDPDGQLIELLGADYPATRVPPE